MGRVVLETPADERGFLLDRVQDNGGSRGMGERSFYKALRTSADCVFDSCLLFNQTKRHGQEKFHGSHQPALKISQLPEMEQVISAVREMVLWSRS